MSWLHWLTERGTADLWGSEAGLLRRLLREAAMNAWRINETDDGMLRAALLLQIATGRHAPALREQARQEAKRGDKTADETRRKLAARLHLELDLRRIWFSLAGEQLYSADLELNTALLIGSDLVRLGAKLHTWRADHCWIDGPDRAWAADIIETGLNAGLYRRQVPRPSNGRDVWTDPGWGDVVALLRSDDTGPVVLSHSEHAEFPNPDTHLDCPPGDGHDAREWAESWYDLPHDEQWSHGVQWLRQRRAWARLAPDTLATVTAGPPVTIYDLYALDRDERVQAAARAAATSLTAPDAMARQDARQLSPSSLSVLDLSAFSVGR